MSSTVMTCTIIHTQNCEKNWTIIDRVHEIYVLTVGPKILFETKLSLIMENLF